MGIFELIIAAVSGGLLTKVFDYLTQRRKVMASAIKEEAQAESIELDNVAKAVQIWKDLSDGLNRKVNDLEKELEELKANSDLKCKNCIYKKEFLEKNSKK